MENRFYWRKEISGHNYLRCDVQCADCKASDDLNAPHPPLPVEGKEEESKRIIPNGQYFVAQCENCGFKASSQEWLGGGQIADTGDYGDGYCPVCGAIGCEEADDDLYIDQREILVKKIAELQTRISEMECDKAFPLIPPTPPAGSELTPENILTGTT